MSNCHPAEWVHSAPRSSGRGEAEVWSAPFPGAKSHSRATLLSNLPADWQMAPKGEGEEWSRADSFNLAHRSPGEVEKHSLRVAFALARACHSAVQTGKSCDAPPANHLKMRDLLYPDKFLKPLTKRNSYLWFSLWICAFAFAGAIACFRMS